MIELLDRYDKALFLRLNGLHAEWLDALMVAVSGNIIWIPFYAFLIFLLRKIYKQKIWLPLLAIIAVITISDRFTSGYMKPTFARLRPCHEPALEGAVHVVNGHCGGTYGFASSHAANTFGVAVLLMGLLTAPFGSRHRYYLGYWLPAWAIFVSYSRIYLGVHYPGDVITGAAVGYLAARLLLYVLSRLKITSPVA